ncbi:MAG: ATP-binding protein, partial [Spirochaetaceae bacterium]|nr:ATP-binding protein [Spirochaetaceae bacterium]
YSDINLLFEILDMLLENAIKFTKKGSITISSSYEKGKVVFIVCDTGIGIPDNKKDLIFQLYRQGNSDINRDYEGLGLGLTIAKKLVDLLGGNIYLTDNINGGSCFHINISMPFKLNDQTKGKKDVFFIPAGLSIENKKELKKLALSLSEYVKVFDPGKIRHLSSELVKISSDLEELSKKIINTADTYNESEFTLLVEEMLKGINNEE